MSVRGSSGAFTKNEQEVLELFDAGLDVASIQERVSLTPNRVKEIIRTYDVSGCDFLRERAIKTGSERLQAAIWKVHSNLLLRRASV